MNMHSGYKMETVLGNWTRIEMLLTLYERGIESVKAVQLAQESGDTHLYAQQTIEATRYLLALMGGLKAEDYEIALNVQRLLNFVILRFTEKKYDDAIHFLEKLHQMFSQIKDQANELERAGKIPPLSTAPGLNTMA